jgi:serine/threonine protein kinase
MVFWHLLNKELFIGNKIFKLRDLKPANIMIKNNILKIGDFGFAKKTPDQKFKNKTVVGTPLYMSL